MRETFSMLLKDAQNYTVDPASTTTTILSDSKTFLTHEINNAIKDVHFLLKKYNLQPLASTTTTVANQIWYHNPPGLSKIETVTVDSVGIDRKNLKKAVKRIEQSIKKKERVIIFGDYDVDGICGSAILWETLFTHNPQAMPYIPHRIDEGYGLSVKGIDHVLELYPDTTLIITVDNGIVATTAVEYAKKKNIDVLITDHHVRSDSVPDAFAIVHTTNICGTGVAYLLSKEIKKDDVEKNKDNDYAHLELVALATIADLVPLKGANRALTKKGLEVIGETKRVGLVELFKEASLNATEISSYHVGHIIAPRLNAMGRMEYAMESLRLLCTKDITRAIELAYKLGSTNRERQVITQETVVHAKTWVEEKKLHERKLLFVGSKTYQPGVIGLVAGRLVESYYRPTIVLSIGETHAKASARSISGFNIIEFIRSGSEYLVDVGGHPMAAGFTVEKSKLIILEEFLSKKADEMLTDDIFLRKLKIDCELPFSVITNELYAALKQFEPFGMGNSEPVFMTTSVTIVDKRVIGKDQKHVKFKFSKDGKTFDAVGFGMAEQTVKMNIGDIVNIAYTIDENIWNNTKTLQLKIKDIKI
jgi:single-stranded-DNA-specific exonuclease